MKRNVSKEWEMSLCSFETGMNKFGQEI